jgi:hypothetical protein
MSNTRKHDDLIETFSILDRMHRSLGIDLKAMDAYDVQVIEQLLETSDCVGTAAIIARTSLEQVVAEFMANQNEQELKYFLEELAAEARDIGLDPIAHVNQFAERELGAAKGYAKRSKNLVGREALNSNQESRGILNLQLSEMIGDWKVFVKRARFMASQLEFEPTWRISQV